MNYFEKLNQYRRMAGVPQDFRAQKVIKEDVVPGMNPAIKRGGEHLFYVVTDATSNSVLGDVIAEADTQGLIHIIIGAAQGQTARSLKDWEIFPHADQKKALDLARTRIAKAGGKDVTESQLREFTMGVEATASNPLNTRQPTPAEMSFGSSLRVCKTCTKAPCICNTEQEEMDGPVDMDDLNKLRTDVKQSRPGMDTEMGSDDMDTGSDDLSAEKYDYEDEPDRVTDKDYAPCQECNDEDPECQKCGGLNFKASDDTEGADPEVTADELDRLAAELEGGEGDEEGLDDQSNDWDDLVGRSNPGDEDMNFAMEGRGGMGTRPISWANADKVLKKMKKNSLEKKKPAKVKESAHYFTNDHYPSFSDTNKDKPVNVVSTYDTVFDKDHKKEEDYEMSNDTTPVKVPSKIISELTRVMNEMTAEAEKAKPRDWERSNYYADSAEAFKIVLDFLKMKTVEGLKRAQIYSQRMNSGSRALMPDIVWKFIIDGGQKRSLKSYVSDVKEPVTGKPFETVPVKTLNKNTHTE